MGRDTLNGFNLAYRIDDNFPPVEQYFDNKVIPYSDTVTVSFKAKADLSKYGIYKIIAYGFNNRDDFPFNDTIAAKIDNTKINETLSAFPNPFGNSLTININSQVDDKIEVSISNVSGIKLYDVEKEIKSGSNTFTINDFRLVPSLYYLNVKGTTFNKTIPIVKINK